MGNRDLSSPQSQQHSGEQIVDYTNYGKTYGEGDERVVALEDISFSITEGEFVSIVGPSGCGKSTLLHSTVGIIPPSEGNVEVGGVDVTSPNHEKHNVGIVFQKPVLLQWRTVLNNVMLPVEILSKNDKLEKEKSFYKERALTLLEEVGLGDFKDSYPKELSGGMQQRVAICRSLVYDPKILAMDEPFGALDALTRKQLNKELLRIWGETNKTILFVTHNLEEAIFLSDRVVILSSRPGKVMDVIDIDIDRPRTDDVRTTDTFRDLLQRTEEHFQ